MMRKVIIALIITFNFFACHSEKEALLDKAKGIKVGMTKSEVEQIMCYSPGLVKDLSEVDASVANMELVVYDETQTTIVYEKDLVVEVVHKQ